MKSCPNCRVIHPDEFMGQCADCGAPMGNVQANSSGGKNLAAIYARQRRSADGEAGMESALRNGRHGEVRVNDNVLEAARALLVPKEGAFTDE